MELETDPRFLTSSQAAALLGVARETLYAYVSRGLLQSVPIGEGDRRRLYRRDEVLRLREERQQKRDPSRAVAGALSWGSPLLESQLTLIHEGRLYYRGQGVPALCRTRRFEEVAELLWLGAELEESLFDPAAVTTPPSAGTGGVVDRSIMAELEPFHPVERMMSALPLAAARDFAGYDLRPQSAARCGVRILDLLTRLAVLEGSGGSGTVAERLCRVWCPGIEGARELLNTALILCADHELNVSSFTARTIASAGSTPYDAVIGGLGALRGKRHGLHSERLEALLAELWQERGAGTIRERLGRRLRHGEGLPGFGHPLYREGDPRCRVLLSWIEERLAESEPLELGRTVVDEVDGLLGEKPNIDFALGLLSLVLGLPAGSALTLFALGRTAGWIAHAIEQYARGTLIRPRARYTGPVPAEQAAPAEP